MATTAELDVFINGLTADSIDRAIMCFQDAIHTRQVLPSDFDPRLAQKTCSRILELTANGSSIMDNIRRIPNFWVNLEGLAHNSNLNAVESCITRVFCMQGALSLHYWLLNVVPAAVERSSRNTWIDRLVWDVGRAFDLKKQMVFDSEHYLPNLPNPTSLPFTPPKFQYEKTEIIASTVSSIIRKWLQFPADELSLVQLSIIDIISSRSPQSVMFLDKVWETYKTPFATVFNKWDIRRSKAKLKRELEAFEEQFASHPFVTPDSLEYRKLKYLDQLIHFWMENNTSQANVRPGMDIFKVPS
jgi:hypothetical protein